MHGYNYQGETRTRSPHLQRVLVRLDAFERANGKVPAARAIARGHLIASMGRQPSYNCVSLATGRRSKSRNGGETFVGDFSPLMGQVSHQWGNDLKQLV